MQVLVVNVSAVGTQRLPRIIGVPRAKEMIFLGKIIGSKEALDIGLVNEVAEQKVLERAVYMAGEIAKKGKLLAGCSKLKALWLS